MKLLFYALSTISILGMFLVFFSLPAAVSEVEAGLLFIAFIVSTGFGSILAVLKQTEAGMYEKECPFCAEFIKKKAQVCKHCGRDVPTSKTE